MSETKDTKFGKGQSGNPAGRPKGTGAKPISNLRSTLNKLKELEPRSIENISAIVNGTHLEGKSDEEKEVSKTMLETSKWVISTISSLSRAASAEEQLKWSIKKDAEDLAKGGQKDGTTGNVIPASSRFTTTMSDDD